MKSDRLQDHDVVHVEGAIVLVEDLDDTYELTAPEFNGGAQDACGAVAGLLVHLLVETRIGVGIGDIDRFSPCEDGACDTQVVGETDLTDHFTGKDPGEQFTGLPVVEEQSGPVCGKRLAHHVDEGDEDGV